MNWFNRNRWLGVFLIVFGIAALAALYFLFTTRSSANEALARFQHAVAEKNRLERLDPFPSEANFRKMKLHLENYAAALEKLKQELKTRVPNPTPLAPNEFQGRLRQAMVAVSDRARANRVKLPDNFALGFEEYTTALPKTNMAPLLGQELSEIELLMTVLIDAHIDGISKVVRRPLPDEHGTAGAAAPSPSPSPSARARGGTTAAAGSQLIERDLVEVTFRSSPSAGRRVLNQVVSSPKQFYVIRLLHVRNDRDKGPSREQPGHPAAPAPAAAPPQAAPGKTPPTGGLNFIVGNEHMETSASIELLRFTF